MAEKNEHDDEEVIATKAWDSAVLGRLWQFARPHKRLFIQSFAVLASLLVLELLGPWVWRRALDGPILASKAEGVIDKAEAITGVRKRGLSSSLRFQIAALMPSLSINRQLVSATFATRKGAWRKFE